MPTYEYTAKDGQGNIVSGKLEAPSNHDIFKLVKDKGLYLMETQMQAEKADSVFTKLNRLSNKQLREFTGQLWLPLETGVSINIALSAIYEQSKDKKIKEISKSIIQLINQGHSLSGALEQQHGSFSPLYIAMVRAGENSGSVPEVLKNLEDFLENDADTVAKFRSALIYPFIMVNLCALVVCFLLFYVLPKIMFIFKGKEHALPLPTKFLIAFKDFVLNHPIQIICSIILLIAIAIYMYLSAYWKRFFDVQALKVPLIGKLISQASISRTFGSMSVLLSAGVPILKVIEIIGPISNNYKFQESWLKVADSIKMGNSLAVPMDETQLFSPSTIQMIKMGESTGKVDSVLKKISERMLKEFNRSINDLSTFFEPALLVVMGIIVGFISLAIILPLFAISDALRA